MAKLKGKSTVKKTRKKVASSKKLSSKSQKSSLKKKTKVGAKSPKKPLSSKGKKKLVKKQKSPPLKATKKSTSKKPILKKQKPKSIPSRKSAKKGSSVLASSKTEVKAYATMNRKEKATRLKEEKSYLEHLKKWEVYYKKSKELKPQPFNISARFIAKTPIEHPQFGWGWILEVSNDRLEVLFEDKVRKLISNRK